MKTLTLIIIGIVAIGFGYWLGKNKRRKNTGFCSHSPKMANGENKSGGNGGVEGEKGNLIEKQAEEKKLNLEAILGLMESGNEPLTNDHVKQMLGIPESTVTRYFDELEKEGKIRQVGKTGRNVFYERV
jgi:predicted HTH transcriptional regulator